MFHSCPDNIGTCSLDLYPNRNETHNLSVVAWPSKQQSHTSQGSSHLFNVSVYVSIFLSTLLFLHHLGFVPLCLPCFMENIMEVSQNIQIRSTTRHNNFISGYWSEKIQKRHIHPSFPCSSICKSQDVGSTWVSTIDDWVKKAWHIPTQRNITRS